MDARRVLRHRRLELGLSHAEVAKRAGVSRSTIVRFESGTITPSWDVVAGIAQALDLEPMFVPRELSRNVQLLMRARATAEEKERAPLIGEEW